MALVIPQHGQTCPECGNAVIRTRAEIDGKRYRVCSGPRGSGSCGSTWLLPKLGTSAPKHSGPDAVHHTLAMRWPS